MPGVQGPGGHRHPPPQRRVLPGPLPPPLRGAGAAGDPRARHDRAGRAGARRRLGRQGLARALGHPRARSATRPTASTSGSASATTPTSPAVRARVRREARAARCIEVDLAARLRLRHPAAAQATRRAPCGACGLSKRHLFNSAALEHGYDVVATGHNLDDEAAVLLGNVLRWETGYLGRQYPVLPAAPGFVRKVKPLVRLGEREIGGLLRAARASTTRSRSARWPTATGTSGTRRCSTRSRTARPASKAAFLFGFLERGHDRFAGDADDERGDAGGVPRCAARPRPGDVCAFCRLRSQVGRRSSSGAAVPDERRAESTS